MSVEMLESAAAQLGPLGGKVAFLGGAAMALWVTDTGAPPIRVTLDVDVIVEVASRIAYYELGDQLREQRFEENPDAGHTCAWRHRDTGLALDVMPTDSAILGFSNQWYPSALEAAVDVKLPSGATIRAVRPPHLLGTKIEAFRGRGENDYLGSTDFADIVVLIDGRSELVVEIAEAPKDLRRYLANELARMRKDFAFEGGVSGHLLPDRASQDRAALVHARIQEIVDLGGSS